MAEASALAIITCLHQLPSAIISWRRVVTFAPEVTGGSLYRLGMRNGDDSDGA
jgi:hypothetical protein